MYIMVNIAMSSFSIQNYAEINYLLSSSVNADTLEIKLKSSNMAWTSVSVNLILHSRNEIFYEVNVVEVAANARKAVQILKNTPSHQGSIMYVHHVLGIKADYQMSYEFYLQPVQISTGKGLYEL